MFYVWHFENRFRFLENFWTYYLKFSEKKHFCFLVLYRRKVKFLPNTKNFKKFKLHMCKGTKTKGGDNCKHLKKKVKNFWCIYRVFECLEIGYKNLYGQMNQVTYKYYSKRSIYEKKKRRILILTIYCNMALCMQLQ